MSSRQFPQLIVGVDRSPGGRAALRVAAAESIRRGVPLHAVRVRSFLLGPVDDFTVIDMAFREAFGAIPPGVDIRPAILDTPITAALTGRAHHPGDLLVLGSRRRGPSRWWHRTWSRSVVEGCLRRASCPVLVVSADGTGRRADVADMGELERI
jgi:nucleotide-binding universal stress UspA family protein